MKKSIIRLLLIGLVVTMGCSEGIVSDCPACFTPPEPFWFEIIDIDSDGNLFTDNIYDSNEITIINETDVSDVEYSFIEENDVNWIGISSLGWSTEQVTLSIQVSDRELFKLYVDSERLSDDCCSFTVYNEIRIENADYEFDTNKGVYKIYIE